MPKSSAESLRDRDLIEIRIHIPTALVDRMNAEVDAEKTARLAAKRNGEKVPKGRISRSSVAWEALEKFLDAAEKRREKSGPIEVPPPRPRGRPKKDSE